MTTRGQHIDEWPDRIGVVPDEDPGGLLADVRSVGRRSGFLPAELVAIVGDGPACALLIVLGRKLGQHAHGLVVDGRTVEQGCQLFEAAVLEKADGFCARPAEVLLLAGQFPIVRYQYWRRSNG